MTFPFGKESPFKKPMSEALEKIRRFGILSDILRKYEVIKENCENQKVAIGNKHLSLPLLLLFSGAVASIALGLAEKVISKLKTKFSQKTIIQVKESQAHTDGHVKELEQLQFELDSIILANPETDSN